MIDLVLPFNSKEYLYILFPDSLHQSDEIFIHFIGIDMQLILLEDRNYDTIDHFIVLLQKALSGLLLLHPSIIQDIGYLWNEELHHNSTYDYPPDDEFFGHKNILWTPPAYIKPATTSWLYNNEHNKIIFEITPVYYWHFKDIQECPDDEYITYAQFRETYKPYVIKTLSSALVQEWLDILSPLPVQIAEFTETWNREHKNCDCPERQEMEEGDERNKLEYEKKIRDINDIH